MPNPPLSYVERTYVSRFSQRDLGVVVMKGGVPGDADANAVTADLTNEDGTPVFAGRLATRTDVGTYHISLSSVDTQTPGYYVIVWHYALDTIPQIYAVYIEIGQVSPTYDALDPAMKDVVENVWNKFADLFDSPEGGPNLQTYWQSNWSRERLAKLLTDAIQNINSAGQPFQRFTTSGDTRFPIEKWPGILEDSLYIEALKHLIRSYVEDPAAEGVSGARLDRRDYMDRWRMVLNDELAAFQREVEIFKVSFMGLGGVTVLVGGGVFGNMAPNSLPLSAAARPHYWTLWN
jgi:hypothetical protein